MEDKSFEEERLISWAEGERDEITGILLSVPGTPGTSQLQPFKGEVETQSF